ncbi:Aspartyl protease family protein 1 [Cardamine amara subsp. amara]|uniref:Aspartyl protease family protein 1 n=1 Tax=Cardamine amara subsp. amara TaxID=228776 RepID=A0ABD1A9G8_CARAN
MDVARQVFVLLSVLVVGWGLERCEASGKFSFEVHHIFSDTVRQTLGFNDLLPEKGSLEYFKVLAHRDRFIRGRGLASNNEKTPLTSVGGNFTVAVDFLGFLHYANISVGTPATWFLVALDTGSDLFWLPCNCGTTCIRDLQDAGFSQSVPLNLYSPNASSTSSSIRCNDKRCFGSGGCSSPEDICPYQISSSSSTTGTTGTLIDDLLHLVTEDENLDPAIANVTLGCGQNQTGAFQKSVAVNGVLGLGMKDYSVPSLLAKANITANSFSMCFGRVIGIVGRISFGDKGYTDQEETPLIFQETSVTYGVNVIGVSVSGDPVGVPLSALFDTGVSFTLLLDPAYGVLTKAFDDLMNGKRLPVDPASPFEFCYDLSPNVTTSVEMIFEGGSKMTLRNPFFRTFSKERTVMYCLGILKSLNINIIGQNLMSGHRIVFDRERMILGWKQSNCFEDESLASQPSPPPEIEAPTPSSSPPAASATPPPINPPNSTRNSGTGTAANLSSLATQLLIFLPLLAFL